MITHHITNSTNFVKEFIEFLKKFGVIGLALGAVIAGAVTTLVKTMTETIITPLINHLIKMMTGSTKIGIQDFGITGLDIGGFIAGLINFIVLLFIVYVAIKIFISRFLSPDELAALKI